MNQRHRMRSTPLPLLALLGACASAGSPGGPERATSDFLDGDGPFEVRLYTDFPDAPEFGAGTIYYPVNKRGRIGGVAIAPGFTEEQRHIDWWGPRLASHGYAVLVLDTNDRRERPEARATALLAAVGVLRNEGGRRGSPLSGRIDAERMAIMGHSMGGGGVLIAANGQSSEIRAAIPLAPWEPGADLSAIATPTLILAGEADRVAPVDEHSRRHFDLIPESTPKVYIEFAEGDHYIADTTRGRDLATVGRYALAWLGLYLDNDERFRALLYGPIPATDAAKFSRYVTNP